MKIKRITCFLLLITLAAVLLSSCAAMRPRDELMSSVPSPNGKHIMNIYRNNGGATTDWSTTVSISFPASGKEKNVYFHYHEEYPDEAVWIDNETVRINGIELNIYDDYYESFEY